MKYLLFFFTLTIASCNAKKESVQNVTNDTTVMKNQMKIEVLAEGSHGGYETSKYIIIKEEKTLREVFTKVNMIRRPGFPIPKIDFENEMVIALFMGQKNNGGYGISVKNIVDTDDSIEIQIKEVEPEGMTTMVICQPFYFCKIPKSDKNVVFKKVE
ncbi:protease complex subunit PrcB family protein [Urechidicola croceus]|nr:protease complex subunit PrcB family protein [Urechidicola croceus]